MDHVSVSSTSGTHSPEAAGISSRKRAAPATRRVLILHVRAGAGHERAARAVARAMKEVDPQSEPLLQDALEFASVPMKYSYASTYNRLVARAPRVWGVVYRRSETPYRGFRQRWRTRVTMWLCNRFLRAAEQSKPDAILCTQFLPSEVFATLREQGRLEIPVYTAITDFAIHPIWVYRGMDRYFVATQQVKDQLVDTGEVPPERIKVTGVPIDPKFATSIASKDARLSLGLDPDPERPVFMLMGGGFGWGPLAQMLEVVLSLPDRVQALVIAGRNTRLRRKLEERARPFADRIKIHGFTDRVDLFMAASDLMVGKSGGLTMSEAMARGLPVIVFRPIPGQEERNCDFLQEAGAGVRVLDFEDLHYRLNHFLIHPEHLAVMRDAALKIGRPRAAADVARLALEGR